MNKLNSDLFDIEKVKIQLDTFSNLTDQIRMLYHIRTDYQQYKQELEKGDKVPFDKQVDLEISYRIFEANYKSLPIFDQPKTKYGSRLKVVDNLKPLILSFQALMQHKGDNGAKYLSINDAQLVYFLSNVLQYEDGRLVNWDTVSEIILNDSNNQNDALQSIQHLESLADIDRKYFYHFDIEKVKKILQALLYFEDRLLFLNRVHMNFLQHQNPTNSKNIFSSQIELELQQQRVFKWRNNENNFPVSPKNRIRVNGRVNVMMTFFYELLAEFPEKYGRTCLYNTKGEIINFVLNYFESQIGRPFSIIFLRNTLTPSKFDKRCSTDKRVQLKYFWEKR